VRDGDQYQLRRVVPVPAGRRAAPPRAAHGPLHHRRPRRRGDQQRRLPAAAELRVPRPGLQRGEQPRLRQQQHHDARNPIFGARTDADGIVVDSTLFYRCRSRAAAGRPSAACCGGVGQRQHGERSRRRKADPQLKRPDSRRPRSAVPDPERSIGPSRSGRSERPSQQVRGNDGNRTHVSRGAQAFRSTTYAVPRVICV
jgi:hypothetical protein